MCSSDLAHGLTKRFGDFTAVDHVSFTIQKGEIFGFLGSNGCGKSTTMKMLTGLLEATEGDATLLGKPIDAGGLDTKMRVGYMSQAFSLYEELSVRRNLDLHADFTRWALKARRRWRKPCNSLIWRTLPTLRPHRCRWASANACNLPPPACITLKY